MTLNERSVQSFSISVRENGPILKRTFHKDVGNVSVFVESGFHRSYRSTTEKGYNASVNSSVTSEFGWYYICNDRIIIEASTEPKLGFPGVWHPEYNGFVGIVRFVSDDPEALPWDTKKTEIDPNADPLRKIKDKLITLVGDFRRENRNLRKKPNSEKAKGRSGDGGATQAGGGAEGSGSGSTGQKGSKKEHITSLRKLLPSLKLHWSDKKLESLLCEAEALSVEYPFAGSALLRMIVERLLSQHIRRSGRFEEV